MLTLSGYTLQVYEIDVPECGANGEGAVVKSRTDRPHVGTTAYERVSGYHAHYMPPK